IKEHITNKGEKMAFAALSDMSGETEAVIFPSVYAKAQPILSQGAALYVSGKVSADKDGRKSFIPDEIMTADEYTSGFSSGTLYIRCLSTSADIIRQCADILKGYPGERPVYFVLSDTKRTIAHKEIKTCSITGDLVRELAARAGGDNIRIKVTS
ncbi:MAG: hypothetical protein ILP19_05950, partial [Oscillospiraceae bacterium]|nr:hypothetical protein [Oscillospiraceae bacterium]